jgi:hypothetical protein
VLRRFQHGRWRHLLVALGGVHLIGGPLVVLQLLAWAGMLISYSAEDGLARGLQDTFSGERPCALCQCIDEMEQQEPAPALPTGEEQRRLAESLGQSLRIHELVDVPLPDGRDQARAWSRWGNVRCPGPRGGIPEVPPPRELG